MKNKVPYIVKSISQLHELLGLPKPKHPLISIYRFDQITQKDDKLLDYFCPQFYSIAIKKNFKGKVRYGHSYYDFDEGMMCFIGPGQLLADLLAGHPLAGKIKTYGFFSYDLTEALHLCEDESAKIETIISEIENEYKARIDTLSQDVMVTHIELLLYAAQRFYNRQFITRRPVNHNLLEKLNDVLEDYLRDEAAKKGLPTVQYIAAQLNLSPNYLGDMLRATTGSSTRQHIQNKLIEKSKELLLATSAPVADIAYQLGFERPQSLSKLFRNVTGLAPSDFRSRIN